MGGPEVVSSETLLRAVVAQSTDLILVLTRRHVAFANPCAMELYGADIVGRSPSALASALHPDDLPEARERFIAVFAQPGHFDAIEVRIRRADDWGVYEVTATNLTEDPDIGGVLFSARDVTERHRARQLLLEQERRANAREMRRQEERLAEQLRRARQMDTVGRLAAGAAHDFGNLLGVVANCTAAVARSIGDDHPARADLELIDDAVARATDLVQQLLFFGAPTVPRTTRFDLRGVVDDVIALMSTGASTDVEITHAAHPEALDVVADRSRIERALMNVVVNALDALAGRGHVWMRSERVYVTSRPATALGVEPGGYARLTVRDDGPGMDPSVLDRAFEPFFTTAPSRGGTGLGLTAAKDAVERAGGAISLRSELGRGTTVTMVLPVAPLQRGPSPMPPSEAGGPVE